jgi:CBS domain-containing protein
MSLDARFIGAATPVREVLERAVLENVPGYLVGTPDALCGAVTRGQLEEWQAQGSGELPLASVLMPPVIHAHPDHPIDVVLERLWSSGGVLPIVSRSDARHVEGVVTADSMLRRGRGLIPGRSI